MPLNRVLKIVVFDQHAEQVQKDFAHAEPAAAAMASIEFVNASLAPDSPDWKRAVTETLKTAGRLLGVALTLGEDDKCLCAALEMRAQLDRDGNYHVPVYARLEHYRQLGEVMLGAENMAGFRDRLQIFGTLEETLSVDVLLGARLDSLARALHEDHRRISRGLLNPAVDVGWVALPDLMKMSNRWRADQLPVMMELAGLHMVRDVKSPAGLPPGEAEIELLAQLEHRRCAIDRRLDREAPAEDRASHLEGWGRLPEAQQISIRQEAARVPQIMAGMHVEALPVRTVRLYGERLTAATDELSPILAAPQFVHCNLIVDLDDSDAVRFSARAMDLPSLSVWLFSREAPPELLDAHAESAVGPRGTLIQRAAGWAPRLRVSLQTASDAAIDGIRSEEVGAAPSKFWKMDRAAQ